MAFLGFQTTARATKKQSDTSTPKASYFWWPLPGVDQAPSRGLSGKVRGTQVSHNAPKNATDSAETYPKKTAPTFSQLLVEKCY